MLIQFAVENFLSFKDKVVFSMAASADEQHPTQVCTLPGGLRLVHCAALYGANGSGKSNVVKTLQFARKLITEGTRPGERIPVTPFKLLPKPQLESRFEFEIWTEGRRYSYGFVVSATAVSAEWLYRSEGQLEQLCFERDASVTGGGKKAKIRLGDIYGPEQARVQFVAEGTRPEQLFLTESEDRDVAELKPLCSWFRDRLKIIAPEATYSALAVDAEQSPAFLAFLKDLLRSAGTGITGLNTRRTPEGALPKSLRTQLLESLKNPANIVAQTPFGDIVSGKAEGTLEQLRLITQRDVGEGALVDFELEEESDGTRRLLNLAPALFFVRNLGKDEPAVFIIDELERSLHPLLTRRFVQDYLASACPGGQMIFTTHDTNLQDLAILRADEIWFMEKAPSHASVLYSLAEFKPEPLTHLGLHLEDGYLNGRFGAIPFFEAVLRGPAGAGNHQPQPFES